MPIKQSLEIEKIYDPLTFNIVGLSQDQLESILFALEESQYQELYERLWQMWIALPEENSKV